jgi:hypothetical protein
MKPGRNLCASMLKYQHSFPLITFSDGNAANQAAAFIMVAVDIKSYWIKWLQCSA